MKLIIKRIIKDLLILIDNSCEFKNNTILYIYYIFAHKYVISIKLVKFSHTRNNRKNSTIY